MGSTKIWGWCDREILSVNSDMEDFFAPINVTPFSSHYYFYRIFFVFIV